MARAAGAGALNELSATEIAHGIAAEKSPPKRSCAIASRASRARAVIRPGPTSIPISRCAGARARPQAARGPLHGVPIGVKDIIDTADLPTEMGSPIYKGHRPATDAACVALVRAAGAVILGKTVTAEFAGMSPGPTTNPHNPAHTPGGSSSGSAAAVADLMVPAAFGTQTGGSVLRPAAYCGVFGYKPTFNAFNRAGMYPAAESLDTIGLIARTIDDVELISAVLELRKPRRHARSNGRRASGSAARRFGTPRSRKRWPRSRTRRAARQGRRPGARDRAARGILGPAQCLARDHQQLRARDGDGARMGQPPRAHQRRLRKRIELGRAMPHADYVAALRLGEYCRARLRAIFDESMCCSRPASMARRRAGSATPAIPASRRSGPFSTRPR